MRAVVITALLAALLPGVAQAADCGPLKIVDRIQMVRATDTADADLIPVLINGQPGKFLFDTGGSRTQIAHATALRMNLPIHQGDLQMMDMTGKVSRDAATLETFQFGHMRGRDVRLPAPTDLDTASWMDGLLAPEALRNTDFDVDFGTDIMNVFSTDHCDGAVVYWRAPAVAVVPIVWHDTHMVVPITLDGHAAHAMIDTGASDTALFVDSARVYNLTLGDADTPENGVLNGDKSLKTYGHVFKSLAFGTIAVNNPRVTIVPNAMGHDLSRAQLVEDRTKSEKDLLDMPDIIIGMNVLRKLHVYFAMKENNMYITDASVPVPAAGAPAAGP